MQNDMNGAIDLLCGLVSIPSYSRCEAEASQWLVEQMQQLGFVRAYVDGVGNAVGEMGLENAQHTIVLLGHIDTVPGNIPVRIESGENGERLLYGRGTVDAKGPLATFVVAASRLGAEWAARENVRLLVVGAVEEEAATSKGARFIRDRFGGQHEPLPDACVIGEPSSWNRITLGYKGRLLVDIDAWQPMAHTAGPDPGVAVIAVDMWNHLAKFASSFNKELSSTFGLLMPSIREVATWQNDEMQDGVTSRFGIRLPLNFDVDALCTDLISFAAARIGATETAVDGAESRCSSVHLDGTQARMRIGFGGYEPAWRSERNTDLVRAFLGAIRHVKPDVRPKFVVKTGTSDMNVVGPAWQCPIVAYGPGDSTLDHTANEHLSIEEYGLAIETLTQALRLYGGRPT